MTRLTIAVLAAGLLIVSLGMGGCVDNNRSLTIMGNKMVDDSCSMTEFYLLSGLLDLDYTGFCYSAGDCEPYYQTSLIIRNAMQETEDCDTCNLHTWDVMVEGIELHYRFVEGRDFASADVQAIEDWEDELPLSVVFEAGSSENKILGVVVLPGAVGEQLRLLQERANDVVIGSSMRLVGSTLGGSRIESNEFTFPIRLCWGCLNVTCPAGVEPKCYPGQDSPQSCSEESN
ncbi:MAG: hypothetical protein JXR96_09560 [Deltaproteobacteria bacterium]|nr:hypothetical protein [Deltaproteobacteria bacterium]